MAESLHSTPKRKRGEPWSGGIALHPLKFSFDASVTTDPEDGSSSPRTKVAHRFRGLDIREGDVALQGGGGVRDEDDDDEHEQTTKRQRHDEPMKDVDEPTRVISDLPGAAAGDAIGITDGSGKTVPQPGPAEEVRLLQEHERRDSAKSVEVAPAMPPSEPVARKRSGTPPLRAKKLNVKSEDTDIDIIDPVRAALTWHDDEITIYDPEDEEDDGTGLNGVGFKPTAAIASARVLKRRQQMAEYKRREESEARARRNQRRRGAALDHHNTAASQASGKDRSDGNPEKSPRKVRFNDVGSSPKGIKIK